MGLTHVATCAAPEQLARLVRGWSGDLTLVLRDAGVDFASAAFQLQQDAVPQLGQVDAASNKGCATA